MRFWGTVLFVAALSIVMLGGCKEMFKLFGCEEDPDGSGGEKEITPATSLFVSGSGDNDNDGTVANPFAMLAHAYNQALADSAIRTIVVLSDITEKGNLSMTLDATNKTATDVISITSDTGARTLTRSSGINDSVVVVTGGAKVAFSNITIDGNKVTGNGGGF